MPDDKDAPPLPTPLHRRPRLFDTPTCPVMTRLPEPIVDELAAIASRRRCSVSSVVRSMVIFTLKK